MHAAAQNDPLNNLSEHSEIDPFYDELAKEIVPIRKKEKSVTRLSRKMVHDYIKAKDKIRYFTPVFSKKGIRLH